jgi:hypothetical protein
VTGSGSGSPLSGYDTTLGVGPSRYQVTTFAHSPASVSAINSPTRPLSSVDLPAFTFPAIATPQRLVEPVEVGTQRRSTGISASRRSRSSFEDRTDRSADASDFFSDRFVPSARSV